MGETAIEVVYGTPDRQSVVSVPFREGMTVLQAIQQSGILVESQIEEQHLNGMTGIWHKACKLNDKVSQGDRVEIYRSLILTPNEARQLRLAKKKEKSA